MYTGTVNQFTIIENDTGSIEMAELFSSSYQGGIEMSFLTIWLVFVLVLIILPIYVLVKYIKKDSDLHRKKKEKEIELLQAQIDSLKEEKGN